MSRTATKKGKCTWGGTRKGKAPLTEEAAKREAEAWNTVSDGRPPMQAYGCTYCGMWHIGHSKSWGRNRRGNP